MLLLCSFALSKEEVKTKKLIKTQMYENLELALGVSANEFVFNNVSSDRRRNGPTEEELIKIADNFFKVQQSLSFNFPMSDYISLGMYTLRSLAELGTYTVPHEDISVLIKSFEQLLGEEFDPLFHDAISQIEKIYFSKRRGKFYAKIYSKDKSGIRIDIDKDVDGNKINYFHIKNKARLYFSDVDTSLEEKGLKNLIVKKIRFLFFPIKALNQIHPQIIKNIRSYLKAERQVKPLKINVKDMYVRVNTQTIFKKIDFKVKKAYAFPGMSNGTEPLPSFAASARSSLLKIKSSIDQ